MYTKEFIRNSYCFFTISGQVPSSEKIDDIFEKVLNESNVRNVPPEKVWLELIEKGEIDNPGEEKLKEYREKVAENERLVAQVSVHFKDEECARAFLHKIVGMEDKEIIILLKRFKEAGLCIETPKSFYNKLLKVGLYKTKYQNWNFQLNH